MIAVPGIGTGTLRSNYVPQRSEAEANWANIGRLQLHNTDSRRVLFWLTPIVPK